MRTTSYVAMATMLAAVLSMAPDVKGSDPVGVYGVIEKVVFEPDENGAQRVQVWGAFALSDGKPGSTYLSPQRGYLYFSVPRGKEDLARKEWSDLKSVAGTSQGVAFGVRYGMNVRVRGRDDKPDSPDRYPIGNGVSKVNAGPLIDAVKGLLRRPK